MAPITINCVSVRRMSEAKCDPYCSHQSERRFTPELPLQIVPPSHSIISSAYATTKFDASRAARRVPRLLRRDVGDPHDLAPLLGGSELLGIERHRHCAEIAIEACDDGRGGYPWARLRRPRSLPRIPATLLAAACAHGRAACARGRP